MLIRLLGLGLLLTLSAAARPRDYSEFDRYALAATPEDEKTLGSLAKYLGGGKPASVWDERVHFWLKNSAGDEFKARTLYRWMADRISYEIIIPDKAYSIHEYRSPDGRYGSHYQDPAYILKTRKAYCFTYALMYLDLADRMGLHCKYDDGDARLPDGEWGQHAWNLVQIDGQWRAVDATWASGYCAGKDFVKRFHDPYFLIPMAEWKKTHRPYSHQ